jgi:hypothetical protein
MGFPVVGRVGDVAGQLSELAYNHLRFVSESG